jgi:hypothetical protein
MYEGEQLREKGEQVGDTSGQEQTGRRRPADRAHRRTMFRRDAFPSLLMAHPHQNRVVAHHEHWDGQGYPDHGAGEAIPPGARRIVFVDSQDAMTSRRVDREALTTEQARADLQWCAGSYVDPLVGEMFLRR